VDEDEARCQEITQRLRQIAQRLAELQPPANTEPVRPRKTAATFRMTDAIVKEEQDLKAERDRLELEKSALVCD
jgi:hypothetical protein